jgi:Rrf2 family protein
MKLQISTRLAIFAVLELAAAPGRQLSVGEISEKYGVSSHHLAKVMNVLARAGLVRSVRGAAGGYQFTGSARRTTLLDVIQRFETLGGPYSNADAPGEGTPESKGLRQVLAEIDDVARATLGSITIATMRMMVDRINEADSRKTSNKNAKESVGIAQRRTR